MSHNSRLAAQIQLTEDIEGFRSKLAVVNANMLQIRARMGVMDRTFNGIRGDIASLRQQSRDFAALMEAVESGSLSIEEAEALLATHQ